MERADCRRTFSVASSFSKPKSAFLPNVGVKVEAENETELGAKLVEEEIGVEAGAKVVGAKVGVGAGSRRIGGVEAEIEETPNSK